MIGIAILLTVIVVPARELETVMRTDVEAARLAGFPQLPPAYATGDEITEFIEEWDLTGPGAPSEEQIEEISIRLGEYLDESALFALGIIAGLLGLVVFSAIAFTRALNNLYALGHEFSVLSPAWAFASWFIPLLSFVLPWRTVSEVLARTWDTGSVADEDSPRRGPRWTVIVAGLWGASYIGLWLLNPISLGVFLSTNDIDGWINLTTWSQRMMLWLPVPAILTAVLLLAVSIQQRNRYVKLDARARSSG